MSRKIVRHERRKEILQALHECLKEKPFHKTTIKDIAQKAGINHGMLHYYFEDKEDILLNYIDFTADRYRNARYKAFQDKLEQAEVTVDTLSELFHWGLSEVSFDPAESRIFTEIWSLALYSPAVMKKLKALYRQWRKDTSTLLENVIDDKKLASKVSLSLMAISEGFSLFSVFFSKNDLCTNIDFPHMLQSLTPDDQQIS